MFPETRLSAIESLRSENPMLRNQGWSRIIAAYWKPVYKYIRVRWHADGESAQDLTQAFFTRALEKDHFAPYNPATASFRTYLRVCLDGFIANDRQHESRQKRYAGPMLSLDFKSAEGELRSIDMPVAANLDEFFYAEWRRSLFELALERFRCTSKPPYVSLFERYHLCDSDSRPSYAELATESNLTINTVTNHLAAARRDFRRALLETLRDITANEREFHAEAAALTGERFP